MSTCPNCNAAIPSDARFCTGCGTPLPRAGTPRDGSDACSDDIHTALAAANLLKLRGEWQPAIEKCMEVLAADQDNAEAHSILGDIYRDQGHVTEAMHWYKLALDLNPDSTADHIKLEQIIAHTRQDRFARRNRTGELVTTAKRVVVEAALAIGLLLIITTVWPIIWGPKSAPRIPQSEIRAPSGTHPRVHLPVDVTETDKPPQDQAERSFGASMSGREDTLLRTVNAAPRLVERGLHITNILIDPRTRSAVVCMVSPPSEAEPAAHWLARSGLIALREACVRDSTLQSFTVRVLSGVLQDKSVVTEVRFVADADRNSILSIVPETATYSQIEGVLRDAWWADGVRP